MIIVQMQHLGSSENNSSRGLYAFPISKCPLALVVPSFWNATLSMSCQESHLLHSYTAFVQAIRYMYLRFLEKCSLLDMYVHLGLSLDFQFSFLHEGTTTTIMYLCLQMGVLIIRPVRLLRFGFFISLFLSVHQHRTLSPSPNFV